MEEGRARRSVEEMEDGENRNKMKGVEKKEEESEGRRRQGERRDTAKGTI